MLEIQNWLQGIYASLPNHNYGWWITTREHHDVATLVTATQFIYGRFGTDEGVLSDEDYNGLQQALGRPVPASGAKQSINRHLLLNMWRPLKLIERTKQNRINPFRLTHYGLELAQTAEPRRVLETILKEIRFVDPKWTKPTAQKDYARISVHPYRVLLTILRNLDGYLVRDEYRLFVARMRNDDDESIEQSVEFIKRYRTLSSEERSHLISLEEPYFPSKKPYSNWVDMDLHTFSLFALGTQFRRNGQILVLAGTTTDATLSNSFIVPENVAASQTPVAENLKRRERRQVELRTPGVAPELDLPPVPSFEANNGQEAEMFIMRLLEANDFEVRNYSRLRGFGFDLWARHLSTEHVFYCEVKSSTSRLSTISLTRLEAEAARKYGERYVVFCVENFKSSEADGDVWTIQNPWENLPSIQTPKMSESYSAPRSEWRENASKLR